MQGRETGGPRRHALAGWVQGETRGYPRRRGTCGILNLTVKGMPLFVLTTLQLR